MKTHELLAYCRPGFESECAQELAFYGAQDGGFARTIADSGLVEFVFPDAISTDRMAKAFNWRNLIFTRQLLRVITRVEKLPVNDRISVLLPYITTAATDYCDAWIETADTEDGKALAPFCRAFNAALIATLKREHLINRQSSTRLHLCFLNNHTAFVATADTTHSSPWPGGIPRLKFPRSAPSRSTLKLDEAFLVLLTEDERIRGLQPEMTAVDLGAAPGGWTWQLVQRSIRVTAVDNGPMDGTLIESGLVTHLREDGFRFQPKKSVDWLVCDMVEQPRRVADLIARWLIEGWCQRAIFNLKLPMKKRYDEVKCCLDLIESALHAVGKRVELRAKQLYHDREEITVFASLKG